MPRVPETFLLTRGDMRRIDSILQRGVALEPQERWVSLAPWRVRWGQRGGQSPKASHRRTRSLLRRFRWRPQKHRQQYRRQQYQRRGRPCPGLLPAEAEPFTFLRRRWRGPAGSWRAEAATAMTTASKGTGHTLPQGRWRRRRHRVFLARSPPRRPRVQLPSRGGTEVTATREQKVRGRDPAPIVGIRSRL